MISAAEDAKAIFEALGLSASPRQGRASPMGGAILPGAPECDTPGL